MFLEDCEYITLRIIRKFLLRDNLLKSLERVIPYYKTNQNQLNPEPIVEQYLHNLSIANISVKGEKSILEIGVGATNSIGYEMVAREKDLCYFCYEPYAKFDEKRDKEIFKSIAEGKSINFQSIESRVRRIQSLDAIGDKSVDVILSNSVLEHVADMGKLITDLQRVLKKGGCMLHLIDYRDHFFKYPFHFLKFSEKSWNKFLNPGDLPRWRIDDHMNIFKQYDYKVHILGTKREEGAFQQIKSKIHPEFSKNNEQMLSITHAALFVN